ncbi:hypothetical protein [Streptomyces sp. YU58]|uniref:hypothetical protein n=1 Tax=Streptomyces sp. SX92 TaxID=3158972 RepID=UPI0027BAF216|nr:hypothetical protein [Streptomyces coralus]WLW50292.1 hypothetical protein QU709_02480 [Streptomyces coralus]
MGLCDAARDTAGTAHDLRWARDVRDAVYCAGVLLALLLLLDRGAGLLTPGRGALWIALALLFFAVLCPARVRAGADWLSSGSLVRERRVRTDLLVSVRCVDGLSQRLVLRDALGGRVEIDPEVLVRNPQLWFRVETAARKAVTEGTLLCGATALRRIARRIDREAAQAVFRASGLE